MGLRMYSFIDVSVYCLNYVRSVARSSAAFNPSWHLTASIAVSGFDKIWVCIDLGARWLSFFR